MDLMQFVDRAMDVPFLEVGRDYAGWDCYGLIYMAYKDIYSIHLPLATGEYNSTRRREELQALLAIHREGEWKLHDPYEPGDVALVKMLGRNCHIGLMLPDMYMLHVQHGVEAVVERIDRPPWRDEGYDKVEGVYRHVLRA